jgi:hypothetical protein
MTGVQGSSPDIINLCTKEDVFSGSGIICLTPKAAIRIVQKAGLAPKSVWVFWS